MPWCPKCKNEYREGITLCADCQVELVDELPLVTKDDYELLIRFSEEDAAKRLVAYLEYSSLSAYLQPEEEGYGIYVLKKKQKEAKKAFGAFYTVELTKAASEITADAPEDTDKEPEETALESESEPEDAEEFEEELEEALTPSAAYVKKSEKSADYRSSAITFLLFGVVGLIAMILHWAGVYSYFSEVSSVVLTVLFAAFIGIGIDSFKRAKKAQVEALEEARFTEELTRWLEEHLTIEMLTAADAPEFSREANFLNEMNEMKRIICEQFGTVDASFLEQFTEEYYNEHFESNV